MRVISGSARGRRLNAPQDHRIRPTSDRIKEALFSIIISLCGDISGFRVLDIFCGTGSLGIEALSRGAASAVFVDNHRNSISLVRANLESTGLASKGEVIVAEASASLERIAVMGLKFDLVLADPPYNKGMPLTLLTGLISLDLLAEGGVVVIETSSHEGLQEMDGFTLFNRRVYGDTALSFYSSTNRG